MPRRQILDEAISSPRNRRTAGGRTAPVQPRRLRGAPAAARRRPDHHRWPGSGPRASTGRTSRAGSRIFADRLTSRRARFRRSARSGLNGDGRSPRSAPRAECPARHDPRARSEQRRQRRGAGAARFGRFFAPCCGLRARPAPHHLAGELDIGLRPGAARVVKQHRQPCEAPPRSARCADHRV